MTKKHRNKNLLLLSCILLASCVTTSPKNRTMFDLSEKSPEYYLTQAAQSQGAEQASLKLKAAVAYERRQQSELAYSLLSDFQVTELPATQRDDYYFLLAKTSHQLDRELEALTALQYVNNPKPYGAQFPTLYADTLSANERYVDAAIARIRATKHIQSPQFVEQQQELAWQELIQSSFDALDAKRMRLHNTNELGWVDLALLHKGYSRHAELYDTKKHEWQTEYANHPALKYAQQTETVAHQTIAQAPTKVALFLPMSARYKALSSSIRDGFISANFDRPTSEVSSIKVYDTDSGLSLESLYQLAQNDGVEFVIGPLLKGNIQQLAQMEQVPLPTLALNQVEGNYLPANFYQFGMPVEQEAMQIANTAIARDQKTAFVINADKSLGQRAIDAFTKTFEEQGGNVIRTADLSQDQNPQAAIMRMLGADQADKRTSEIRNLLNLPIVTSGQVTTSAEFIFMVSKTPAARIIKPYLNYYYAYDLPVYATSGVYSGRINPNLDNDLKGIQFLQSPWLLGLDGNLSEQRKQTMTNLPSVRRQTLAFYALGYDAHLLIDAFSTLLNDEHQTVEGLSGVLSMDFMGRIQRTLTWAEFQRGSIRLVE